jgi:hypothetical protein
MTDYNQVGVENEPYKVRVVIDRAFGHGLALLEPSVPVWTVNTSRSLPEHPGR